MTRRDEFFPLASRHRCGDVPVHPALLTPERHVLCGLRGGDGYPFDGASYPSDDVRGVVPAAGCPVGGEGRITAA